MLTAFVMATPIVTMDLMKLKSFAIVQFVRRVNFGVIMERALRNRKNAMEYATVPMVRTKYNVDARCIVVGEFLKK